MYENIKSIPSIAYGRTSTKRQDLDVQMFANRQYASKNGFRIVAEYTDFGVSGVKQSRPEFELALADLRNGRAKTLLLYRLDRMGRSLVHLIQLLQEFRAKGIRVVTVSDGIDTARNDLMTELFWKLLAIFAEFERELIVSRVRAGLAKARATGKRLGRPSGAKDKGKRSTAGYLQRYIGKKREDRKLGKRGELK